MKIIYIVLCCLMFSLTGCNKKSRGNNDTLEQIDTINNPLLKKNRVKKKQYLKKENKNKILNKDLILNKTFYYITHTDSGDVVVNSYESGFDGFVVTANKIVNFGSETFFVNIDSIVPDSKKIKVYVSSMNKDIFGNVTQDTGSYCFEPNVNEKGVFNIDNVSLMVDSIYTNKTIPIVKEKPYDIEKAIGDF